MKKTPLPINSRRKGSVGEIELCRLLEDTLGYECERNLEQPRTTGVDILSIPMLAIEVKRRKGDSRGEHAKWWAKLYDDCPEGRIPVLAYRENQREWRFICPVDSGGGWPEGRDINHTIEMRLLPFLDWAELAIEGGQNE